MIKSATCIASLAFLSYKAFSWYIFLGYPLSCFNTKPGTCKVVESAGLGSEDLQVTSEGLVFITSGCTFTNNPPQFNLYMTENDIKGRIFLYNFKKPKQGAIELKIKSSPTFSETDFRGHGISILEDPSKGEHLVYVVNHPFPKPDSVEKFRFKPNTNELIHLHSFTSEAFRTVNDLAVVEEDRFYITNFIYSTDINMAKIESILQMPWCNILFYNGNGFQIVAPSLNSPNGVILSKDKKFLYVAMFHQREIRVFKILEDNNLLHIQTVPVHTLPDNLNLSQDGATIYVGAHPVGHKIMGYIENPWGTAPSQVLSFPLKNGLVQGDDGRQLFYDDGRFISASTVADEFQGELIIGSLLDRLIVCGNISTEL